LLALYSSSVLWKGAASWLQCGRCRRTHRSSYKHQEEEEEEEDMKKKTR
jgi:hypothetical protein